MTTMDNKKVVDKIRKLLALGTSDNPNESAIALRRAAELMKEYQITEADIAISNIRESEGRAMNCKTPPMYLTMLIDVIANLFQCSYFFTTESSVRTAWDNSKMDYKIVTQYKTRPIFVGFNLNEELASYTYDVLARKLEKARKQYKSYSYNKVQVTRAKDAYCLGWVEAIRRKVEDMVPPKPEVEIQTEKGLVKVDALGKYVEDKIQGSFSARENPVSEKDLVKGYLDGDKETINKGMSNSNLLRIQ